MANDGKGGTTPNPGEGAPVLDLGLLARAALRGVVPSLIIALVFGIAGGVFAARQDEAYETQTQLVVQNTGSESQDASQIQAQAAAYSSVLSDSGVISAIEDQQDVRIPDGDVAKAVTVAVGDIPGVIQLSTKAASPEDSASLADLAVSEMAKKNDTIKESALTNYEKLSEKQIDTLKSRIDNSDNAGVEAELQGQIFSIQQELENERMKQSTVSVLSQSTSDSPVSPKPIQQGAVIGMFAFILALIACTIYFSVNSRAADKLWTGRMAHRYGAEVDGDGLPQEGYIPPTTEATVFRTLADGRNVVILAEEAERVQSPLGDDDSRSENLTIGSWEDSWWRSVAPTSVALGVVLIDKGSSNLVPAELAIRRMREVGVRTRLAIRNTT